MGDNAIATLIAKDEIRELALLYARAIDRRDYDLVHSLYTADGTDTHGASYFPTIDAFVARLREALPGQRRAGFYVCNHLISVRGDSGEGEVYGVSFQLRPDGEGGWAEHQMRSRHIDTYRKEGGRWKFASRVLIFDHHSTRPAAAPHDAEIEATDPSYGLLESPLFRAGARR